MSLVALLAVALVIIGVVYVLAAALSFRWLGHSKDEEGSSLWPDS